MVVWNVVRIFEYDLMPCVIADLFILNILIMKKVIFLVVSALFSMSASAQLMRTEELEKYAKEKYGDKWEQAAENIKAQVSLDKNNSLTYTQVIECPGKSKQQLYVLLNYWYTNTFNDANSVIQLNDKDLGCIIGKGYMAGIAGHSGETNSYIVNVAPIIKTDIKDEKVRVTYTVIAYDADILAGGGIIGMLGGGRVNKVDATWPLEKCFPFAEKDKHKKTSAKALVMTHAYSNVMMDKIEEALTNGLVGNENDNW